MNIDPHGTTIILKSLLVVLLIVPLALLGLTIRIQNPEFRCAVFGADTGCTRWYKRKFRITIPYYLFLIPGFKLGKLNAQFLTKHSKFRCAVFEADTGCTVGTIVNYGDFLTLAKGKACKSLEYNSQFSNFD